MNRGTFITRLKPFSGRRFFSLYFLNEALYERDFPNDTKFCKINVNILVQLGEKFRHYISS
jgi:hypothetical protein